MDGKKFPFHFLRLFISGSSSVDNNSNNNNNVIEGLCMARDLIFCFYVRTTDRVRRSFVARFLFSGLPCRPVSAPVTTWTSRILFLKFCCYNNNSFFSPLFRLSWGERNAHHVYYLISILHFLFPFSTGWRWPRFSCTEKMNELRRLLLLLH